MRSSTWSKDSHGLFDYESTHTTDIEVPITNNCKVIRKGLAVEIKEAKDDLDRTAGAVSKGLANVGVFKNKYWVYDPSVDAPNDGQEQLWLVLRNHIGENGQPGIKLQEGDIIKMGRCKYLVKEMVTDVVSSDAVNLEIHDEPKVDPKVDKDLVATISANPPAKTHKDEELKCRICLGDENSEENPLISSPCKCSGSVKLIHADCLQQWLKSKVIERSGECVTSYTWKQFECDVCKVRYPNTIVCPNGKKMEIFKVQKPESHYMVLHAMNGPQSPVSNSIYIIALNKKDTLRVVRVNDISVSRMHAELKRVGNDFYLSDLNSKFGTLILVRKPIEIKLGQDLTLQAGRTVLSFYVKKPFCSLCYDGGKEKGEDKEVPTAEELAVMMKVCNTEPAVECAKELAKVEIEKAEEKVPENLPEQNLA